MSNFAPWSIQRRSRSICCGVSGPVLAVGRRHDLVGVVAGDALDERAAGRVAGLDGLLEGVGLDVEAELALALALVGAVAGVALGGEDRLDVAAVIDRLRGWICCRRDGAGTPSRQSEKENKAVRGSFVA